MTLQIKLEKKEDYIHAIIEGEFDLNQVKGVLAEMIKSCERKAIDKIILDCAKITTKVQIMDRYFMGEFLTKEIKMPMKIAFMARDDQILPDKFLENVMVNRGFNAKVFADLNKATLWLNS